MSVFGHGQLRLYLLALLREGPRHGYDIIRDLENRFSGLYSPSAGTVYPRLAKLEEEGLVERIDEGRKALYRLTDSGHREVEARQDDIADLEESLDASAARMAEEMRRRVRDRSADLRAEMSAATARLRDAEDRSSAQWRHATDDVEGLLGGLMRGHGPDPEALAQALRRWGSTAGSDGQRSATWTIDDDVTNVTNECCNASEASPMTLTSDTEATPAASPPSSDHPPRDTTDDQHDRRHDTGFPTGDQVREVIAILKDAGERIQRVLDRSRP